MPIYDLAYFDIRICVSLWSVCFRFVIGLSSGLSVCCRLQFQHCAIDRFSIGVMSVVYRSQIRRFHNESYPKWTGHEPDWFNSVFSNIVGGRQLADSLKILLHIMKYFYWMSFALYCYKKYHLTSLPWTNWPPFWPTTFSNEFSSNFIDIMNMEAD